MWIITFLFLFSFILPPLNQPNAHPKELDVKEKNKMNKVEEHK